MKARVIGARHPGSERFEQLVNERYSLATMRGMAPSDFLARTAKWGPKEAYDRWFAAYRANDGSFLEHVAWGADRDLGEGHLLYGAMDDRFASNAARVFIAGGLDEQLHVAGKRACVVGAWDGTENLLLHALGAACVDAIEEVPEFAAMIRVQLEAWQVTGSVLGTSTQRNWSLYEVDVARTWQSYDLLYVPGVLYHLTDLPAALVILWSMLKPGGVLAFESIAHPSPSREAHYLGAGVPGWNWWCPSPTCYEQLLRDAGFPDGRTVENTKGRGWWMGTKTAELPALRTGAAGFSRPDLIRTIKELARG